MGSVEMLWDGGGIGLGRVGQVGLGGVGWDGLVGLGWGGVTVGSSWGGAGSD